MSPEAREFFDFGRSLAVPAAGEIRRGCTTTATHDQPAAACEFERELQLQQHAEGFPSFPSAPLRDPALLVGHAGSHLFPRQSEETLIHVHQLAGRKAGSNLADWNRRFLFETDCRGTFSAPEPDFNRDPAGHHRFAVAVLAAVGRALRNQEVSA